MTGLARCCKPAPPDPIVGFVTRGKGITIHRASCANLERARREQPERLIESNWGAARDEVFPGRHRRRGERSPGPAARPVGDLQQGEDQRHRRQHAHEAAPRAHGVHARGAKPRRAQARARAGGRGERRPVGVATVADAKRVRNATGRHDVRVARFRPFEAPRSLLAAARRLSAVRRRTPAAARPRAAPHAGRNVSATPLLHQRSNVGAGPSWNTCPWWPPQRTQWYSMRV